MIRVTRLTAQAYGIANRDVNHIGHAAALRANGTGVVTILAEGRTAKTRQAHELQVITASNAKTRTVIVPAIAGLSAVADRNTVAATGASGTEVISQTTRIAAVIGLCNLPVPDTSPKYIVGAAIPDPAGALTESTALPGFNFPGPAYAIA